MTDTNRTSHATRFALAERRGVGTIGAIGAKCFGIRSFRSAGIVTLLAALAVAGCRAHDPVSMEGPVAARPVDLGAFARQSSTPAIGASGVRTNGVLKGVPSGPRVLGTGGGAGAGTDGGAAAANDTGADGSSPATPPAMTRGGDNGSAGRRPERAMVPGDAVIVDSMVGQVNGRPIFADEFFEPIEDRLIALAARSGEREFIAAAGETISSELWLVVVNALFLAEAQAALTVQEEQSIRAWLRSLKEEVIANYGGSEERTRQAILEDEGRELEGYLEEQRNRFLIQRLRYERISPRVVVSWRDVEREYRRREKEFNPPPSVTIARIRIATRRAAEIEDVRTRLASGEPFMDVDGAAIWQSFEVEDGDLTKYEEFANETILEQMGQLRNVHDTVGPFEIGSATWWLHVADIERPPQRSLYDADVQSMLTASIRSARVSEEQDRYVESLLEKGIYDELNDMGQRLLRIAVVRYGP